jgi:hypothetical protein
MTTATGPSGLPAVVIDNGTGYVVLVVVVVVVVLFCSFELEGVDQRFCIFQRSYFGLFLKEEIHFNSI